MKLATLADGSRDGRLLVVCRDLASACEAPGARTLQAALDDWDKVAPGLAATARDLAEGRVAGFPLRIEALMAPLPRAFGFIDSSVYLSHMERARALRGATLPDTFRQEPLISLRIAAPFLGPRAAVPPQAADAGIDLEAEVAVITGDVAAGTSSAGAAAQIRLVTLVNDISLRGVIAAETAAARSVYRGKIQAAMAPVAVTPDELGPYWTGRELRRAIAVDINGAPFGRPDAGRDAAFDFGEIIAYAASFRPLEAGTVVASGTVSNADASAGTACIAARRMIETRETGAAKTPYLAAGDRVRIDVMDDDGRSIFGAIEQVVGG